MLASPLTRVNRIQTSKSLKSVSRNTRSGQTSVKPVNETIMASTRIRVLDREPCVL